MKPQTYSRFAKTVAWYMQAEYPQAWAAVAASDEASRAAAAVALACFTSSNSTPDAAGQIAQVVEQLASE